MDDENGESMEPMEEVPVKGLAQHNDDGKGISAFSIHITYRPIVLHDALRGHQFQLPNCIYKFHKQSFIVSFLLDF